MRKWEIKMQRELTDDGYKKIIKVKKMLVYVCNHIHEYECQLYPMPWLPEVLAYLHTDVADVLEEIDKC